MTVLKPRRALLSVADKSGLLEFARHLRTLHIDILSTGGTAAALRDAGIEVTDVSAHTGFPEIMGGRVKTLHPAIHGGILGRRGQDEAVMESHRIAPIDLVVVNLYPFRETVARPDCTLEDAIENIDIGGPAMLRSAAKNHDAVGVIVDPADYPDVISAIENGRYDLELRRKLAVKAFTHTADYDRAISAYLSATFLPETQTAFPEQLSLNFQLAEILRYGENPHQRAAFYKSHHPVATSLATARQRQGKSLSFNNLADADAALRTVLNFEDSPACVIVKHANPCGIALGENIHDAYNAAYKCDPTSAFGGIIALNRGLDEDTAREIISRQFVEVLLAPTFSDEALNVLSGKPSIRVLEIKNDGHDQHGWQFTALRGGVLLQDWDNAQLDSGDLNIVSEREPSHEELKDLLFAWQAVKAVKSNAIVLAKNRATIGIGAGQTSRVYSTKLAVMKAQDEGFDIMGSVLASDAFFPFRDGVDAAAAAGVKAIIQPGGSVRDAEVIAAANEHGIAMIFTGMRHFRH